MVLIDGFAMADVGAGVLAMGGVISVDVAMALGLMVAGAGGEKDSSGPASVDPLDVFSDAALLMESASTAGSVGEVVENFLAIIALLIIRTTTPMTMEVFIHRGLSDFGLVFLFERSA